MDQLEKITWVHNNSQTRSDVFHLSNRLCLHLQSFEIIIFVSKVILLWSNHITLCFCSLVNLFLQHDLFAELNTYEAQFIYF